MMLTLTIDMQSSAQVLGTKPEELHENTTPQVLLELIEDYMLGSLMNEVDADDCFEGEASWQEYQKHLSEAQA